MKPHLPSVLNRETLDRRIEISFHHSLRPCEPQVRAAATTGLGVGGGGGKPVFGPARLGTGCAGTFSVGKAQKIKQDGRDQP